MYSLHSRDPEPSDPFESHTRRWATIISKTRCCNRRLSRAESNPPIECTLPPWFQAVSLTIHVSQGDHGVDKSGKRVLLSRLRRSQHIGWFR